MRRLWRNRWSRYLLLGVGALVGLTAALAGFREDASAPEAAENPLVVLGTATEAVESDCDLFVQDLAWAIDQSGDQGYVDAIKFQIKTAGCYKGKPGSPGVYAELDATTDCGKLQAAFDRAMDKVERRDVQVAYSEHAERRLAAEGCN